MLPASTVRIARDIFDAVSGSLAFGANRSETRSALASASAVASARALRSAWTSTYLVAALRGMDATKATVASASAAVCSRHIVNC